MSSKCNTLTRKIEKKILQIYCQKWEHCNKQDILEYSQTFIINKGKISDENIKIKAEESQNIKIKNKNKNKLISIKRNVCIKNKSVVVEMSAIIMEI